MRDVKAVNALLWVLNIGLGVGIGYFSVVYLLTSAKTGYGLPPERDDLGSALPSAQGRPKNYNLIHDLPNPLTKDAPADSNRTADAATSFRAELKGTFPPDFAFLRIGNQEALATKGEPIRYDDKEIAEIRGWKLVECFTTHAIFSNGRERAKLEVKFPAQPTGRGLGGVGSLTGSAYDPNRFKSRRVHQSSSREIWNMDPTEVDWANQNFDAIMERDFMLSEHGSGGLRIDHVRAESIGYARGMRQGDVIRSVNGVQIKSLTDLKKLQSDPRNQRRNSTTLVVYRRGRPVVLEYRTQRTR